MRHHSPGKDADSLAGSRLATEWVPGGDPAGNRQASLPTAVEVVEEDCVAVDGGIIVGRYVGGSNDVFGQNSVDGVRQRCPRLLYHQLGSLFE